MKPLPVLPLLLIGLLASTLPAQDFGDQQLITSAADGAISVYTADLDGDGDMDVLSASSNDDKIALDSCECLFENYCLAMWNSSGGPAAMGALGKASIAANDLTLTVSGAPQGVFGLFFYGSGEDFIITGEGAICVKPPLNR